MTRQPALDERAKTSVPSLTVRQYLTTEEELQICQQFYTTWRPNSQVMWSGLLREHAQEWADEHGLVTLTTAMGPLMIPDHPLCLKAHKSKMAWSNYVRGASAIFAWYISRGEKVIILSQPPPERFHPSGQTNYQAIEEPILKRGREDGSKLRLEMVYPMVEGAEDFSYQIWPDDETATWTEKFGMLTQEERHWRRVRRKSLVGTDATNTSRDFNENRAAAQVSDICIRAGKFDKKEEKVEKKKGSSKKVALKKRLLDEHAEESRTAMDKVLSSHSANQPSRTRSGCIYRR